MAISQIVRIMLAILLVGSAMFDIVTFIANPQFHIFESNPLYIWTKSVFFVIALKLVINCAMAGIILSPITASNTLRYAFVLALCLAVMMQVMGGVANMRVAKDRPQPSQALPPDEAIAAYQQSAINYFYAPLLVAVIAFKIFELGGYWRSKECSEPTLKE